MAGAFQASAFQDDAFQVFRSVTSTANLRKPVDYVLAGAMPLADRQTTKLSPRGRARPLGTSSLSGVALRHAFSE